MTGKLLVYLTSVIYITAILLLAVPVSCRYATPESNNLVKKNGRIKDKVHPSLKKSIINQGVLVCKHKIAANLFEGVDCKEILANIDSVAMFGDDTFILITNEALSSNTNKKGYRVHQKSKYKCRKVVYNEYKRYLTLAKKQLLITGKGNPHKRVSIWMCPSIEYKAGGNHLYLITKLNTVSRVYVNDDSLLKSSRLIHKSKQAVEVSRWKKAQDAQSGEALKPTIKRGYVKRTDENTKAYSGEQTQKIAIILSCISVSLLVMVGLLMVIAYLKWGKKLSRLKPFQDKGESGFVREDAATNRVDYQAWGGRSSKESFGSRVEKYARPQPTGTEKFEATLGKIPSSSQVTKTNTKSVVHKNRDTLKNKERRSRGKQRWRMESRNLHKSVSSNISTNSRVFVKDSSLKKYKNYSINKLNKYKRSSTESKESYISGKNVGLLGGRGMEIEKAFNQLTNKQGMANRKIDMEQQSSSFASSIISIPARHRSSSKYTRYYVLKKKNNFQEARSVCTNKKSNSTPDLLLDKHMSAGYADVVEAGLHSGNDNTLQPTSQLDQIKNRRSINRDETKVEMPNNKCDEEIKIDDHILEWSPSLMDCAETTTVQDPHSESMGIHDLADKSMKRYLRYSMGPKAAEPYKNIDSILHAETLGNPEVLVQNENPDFLNISVAEKLEFNELIRPLSVYSILSTLSNNQVPFMTLPRASTSKTGDRSGYGGQENTLYHSSDLRRTTEFEHVVDKQFGAKKSNSIAFISMDKPVARHSLGNNNDDFRNDNPELEFSSLEEISTSQLLAKFDNHQIFPPHLFPDASAQSFALIGDNSDKKNHYDESSVETGNRPGYMTDGFSFSGNNNLSLVSVQKRSLARGNTLFVKPKHSSSLSVPN